MHECKAFLFHVYTDHFTTRHQGGTWGALSDIRSGRGVSALKSGISLIFARTLIRLWITYEISSNIPPLTRPKAQSFLHPILCPQMGWSDSMSYTGGGTWGRATQPTPVQITLEMYSWTSNRCKQSSHITK